MKTKLKSSISVLALTAALGANTAIAADMALKAQTPVVADSSWTGFYVGASLGGAWDNASATSVSGGGPPPQVSTGLKTSNVLVGVQAGYNYQINSIVLGVEGDLSGLPFAKTHTGTDATLGMIDGSMSGLASVRGRIGYAVDRTLFYGTGGVGWIGENFQYDSGPGNRLQFHTSFVAPVAGGGVEYKVTSHLTAGVEGLEYLNSGNRPFTSSTGRNWQLKSGNVGVVRAKVSYNW
jgi:outer membrane immunogenic protein